jgi:hypothetical protein
LANQSAIHKYPAKLQRELGNPAMASNL